MKRLQEFIGNLWGQATTISLALATALIAAPVPPELMTTPLRWTLFGAAVLVAFARYVAPPPKAS